MAPRESISMQDFLNAPTPEEYAQGNPEFKTSGTTTGIVESYDNTPDITVDDGLPADPDAIVPYDPVTDTRLSHNDIVKSPVELLSDEELRSKMGLLGQDKNPIIDHQNISDGLRWKTQLLFDRADEKAGYLRKQLPGYEFAIDPEDKTNLILRRKGTKYWGRVDPNFSSDSFEKEVAENIDGIAQAFAIPASAVLGMLASGGIEGLRQGVKKYVAPDSEFSTKSVLINAAAGGAAGKIAAVQKAGKQAVLDAAEAAKAGATGEKALAAVKTAGRFLDNPEYFAQNIGATKTDFARGIEENLGYIFNNVPAAKEALKSPFSIKNKLKASEEYLSKVGQEIGEFYANPEPIVEMGNIFGSEPAQLLDQIITTGKVQKGLNLVAASEATINKAKNVQRDMLMRSARIILPEDDIALNAFKQRKLLQIPEIASQGFKTENDAMMAILQGQKMTPAEARMVRDGIAEQLKFNKTKGQIRDLDTAYKHVLDSFTEGIQKAAEATGDTALIENNRIFNNFAPVVEVLQNTVNANKTQPFKFTQYVPVALGGLRFQAAKYATRFIARPEIRTALGKVEKVGFPMPVTKAVPTSALKGYSFLQLKALGKKEFLPRDSEAYFNDPDAFNALLTKIDDQELTNAMTKIYDRGDKDAFSNVLSMAAAGHEDLFDPAPYASLVYKDGKPIIRDKYDREQYRQWVEENVPSPSDQYEILNALNFTGIMLKEPFKAPELRIKGTPRQPQEKATPLSKVSSNLKKLDMTELDDGSERVDYDH